MVGETVMEAAEDDPAVWDWRSVEAGLPGQILDGRARYFLGVPPQLARTTVALHWKRRFWDCPSIYCTGIVEA